MEKLHTREEVAKTMARLLAHAKSPGQGAEDAADFLNEYIIVYFHLVSSMLSSEKSAAALIQHIKNAMVESLEIAIKHPENVQKFTLLHGNDASEVVDYYKEIAKQL